MKLQKGKERSQSKLSIKLHNSPRHKLKLSKNSKTIINKARNSPFNRKTRIERDSDVQSSFRGRAAMDYSINSGCKRSQSMLRKHTEE